MNRQAGAGDRPAVPTARSSGLSRLLAALVPRDWIRPATSERGMVILHRRRVYILPSGAGYGFAFLLLLLLLGAINYGSSLGFMLTFLLAGTAWVAMHHTYRNLVGLRMARGTPDPVFAGGSARFRVRVLDPERRARYALALSKAVGDAALFDVDGEFEAVLTVPAPRRGRQALGRVVLATRFPLGLFRAWAPFDLDTTCLVYPRPAPAGAAPPPLASPTGSGAARGQGRDDFSGFRDYRPGDSLRHVYWKGAARSNTLLTKRFEGDAEASLWLEWQATAGDDEDRLSRLCRWVLDADEAGRAYGLRLPGVEIAPGRDAAHRARCLAALALHGIPAAAGQIS